MNRTYRLIWNQLRRAWMAAHEGAGAKRAAALAGVLVTQAALAGAPAPTTLPTGGQVVAGQAAIAQSGSRMTVNQATDKAILNWQSFSIGANAAVNFVQPAATSVALNRVLGADASAIYGQLTANGQVFLVNPSGVLFAPGARVDVGGLVATSMNIRNDDFLSGNYRFTRDGATGSVVNAGALNAGYVALLAPEVRNEGVVVARTVALAAGDAVKLNLTGQKLIDVRVEKSTIDTLVENRHLIRADEGTVIMSAQSARDMRGRVVNTGMVEANGITSDGGVIRLSASSNVDLGGSLSANAGTRGNGGQITAIADLDNPASLTTVSGTFSARGGSSGGDGGFVETSGSHLKIADSTRVDTSAPSGKGGQWLLDPNDFTIALSGGDITGATLSGNLGTSDVTIQSSSGAGGTDGDIFVNASVTWASAKKLTLQADRSIQVNAEMNVNGSGTLLLNYDVAGGGGDYFVRAPINLAAASTFQTQQGAGAPVTYTIIRDNNDLAVAGTRPGANLAGNFVLGANVSATTNPWVPIGDDTTPFTGVFDGLGHKVDGVTRANTDNAVSGVGLFGRSDGAIRNVGVTNVDVAGAQNVGGLVGINGGTIKNSYSTGTVTGSDKDNAAFAVGSIGGLVGRNTGNIDDSYSSAAVKASAGTVPALHGPGDQGAGGSLVPDFTKGGIGGLAGSSQSPINNSYATGSVDGVSDVGGLVGYNMGAIGTSYSRGAVNGTNFAGGLIGTHNLPFLAPPMLTNTYWDTTTSGQPASATSGADMSTGLATADMKQAINLNGFDFNNSWVIRENLSYPLLRSMLPPVFVAPTNQTKIYDGNTFGAFAAVTLSTPDTNSRVDTSGKAFAGAGTTAKDAGTHAVTLSGVTLTGANDTDQHGFLNLTQLNGSLVITPKALTVNPAGVANTKVYDATTTAAGAALFASEAVGTGTTADGKPYTGDTVTLIGNGTYNFKDVATATTISFGGLGLGGAQAGNYTLTPAADIVGATITAKALTVNPAGVANTKVYDATTTATGAALFAAEAAGTGTTVDGKPYTGDTVSLTGTGTYNSKDVATATTIAFGGLGLGGAQAGNYTLTPAGNIVGATITAKALTVNIAGITNTKPYDGTTTPVGAAALQTAEAAGAGTTADGKPYIGDTVSLNGNSVYNSKDVATATMITFGGLGLGGAQAGNYSLTPVGNLNATITAKALTVTGQTALDKAFDGNTTAALSGGVLNGVLTDDLANVTLVRGTGAFASATPGTNKPVTVTGTDLAGTAKGNYSVSNPAGLTASITGSDVDTSEVVDRLVQTRSTNNPLNETRNTSDLLRNVAEQLRSTTRTEFGSSGNLAFQQQSGSSNRVDAEDAQRRGDAASTAKGTSTIAGRAKSQLDGYDDTRVSDALAERLGARAALPRGAAGGRGDAVPAGGLVSVTRETGEGESQGVDSPGSDGGGAAMRRQVAGTGAERERAEIRATASGGSRREAIGTGRIGGAGPGGGRLGTSSRGAGGRLGTTGGRLGTGGG